MRLAEVVRHSSADELPLPFGTAQALGEGGRLLDGLPIVPLDVLPVLRKLRMRAPGDDHHQIVMGRASGNPRPRTHIVL